MLSRTLLAILVLAAAPLLGPSGAVAAPRYHPSARVSIATYRTSQAHKPVRDLRAHGSRPSRTRLAATQPRHHPLSRGS